MKVIFEEIVKGNLPKKGKEEKFSITKGEEYYYLYHLGNPSKDRIMMFNINDANSKIFESRCKRIFGLLGYKFNEETRKWSR